MDEQQKVRTITALALAALAESATPYGIESFDSVLKPLWIGIRTHRGKVGTLHLLSILPYKVVVTLVGCQLVDTLLSHCIALYGCCHPG